MKYAAIAGVLLVIGFLGYRFALAESDAYKAYKCFADAVLYLEYDTARGFAATKQVRRYIAKKKSPQRVFGQYRWKQMNYVHIGPYRTIESQVEHPGGDRVTLKVIEEVRRGEATLAPVGPMNVRETREVTMVKKNDEWKVEKITEVVDRLSDR